MAFRAADRTAVSLSSVCSAIIFNALACAGLQTSIPNFEIKAPSSFKHSDDKQSNFSSGMNILHN